MLVKNRYFRGDGTRSGSAGACSSMAVCVGVGMGGVFVHRFTRLVSATVSANVLLRLATSATSAAAAAALKWPPEWLRAFGSFAKRFAALDASASSSGEHSTAHANGARSPWALLLLLLLLLLLPVSLLSAPLLLRRESPPPGTQPPRLPPSAGGHRTASNWRDGHGGSSSSIAGVPDAGGAAAVTLPRLSASLARGW